MGDFSTIMIMLRQALETFPGLRLVAFLFVIIAIGSVVFDLFFRGH